MKDNKIPTSPRSSIESRIDDINLLLSSCHTPLGAMMAVKNLSSDLRAYRDVQKSISGEEHFGYMTRLEKIILGWSKICTCNKKK
jgi:hypothetical protein